MARAIRINLGSFAAKGLTAKGAKNAAKGAKKSQDQRGKDLTIPRLDQGYNSSHAALGGHCGSFVGSAARYSSVSPDAWRLPWRGFHGPWRIFLGRVNRHP